MTGFHTDRKSVICGLAVLALAGVALSCVVGQSNEDATTDEVWVDSGDRKLALGVRPKNASLGYGDSFVLLVTLKNTGDKPLSILRPCGDKYTSRVRLGVTGPTGDLKYTGAKSTYILGNVFTTLQPDESVTEELEIRPKLFAGSETAGEYSISFHYDATNSHKEIAAEHGIMDIWVGEIHGKGVRFKRYWFLP